MPADAGGEAVEEFLLDPEEMQIEIRRSFVIWHMRLADEAAARGNVLWQKYNLGMARLFAAPAEGSQ